MKKIIKKNRALFIFLGLAACLLISRTLFLDHREFNSNAGVPFTKEEQESMIAQQEQADEGLSGSLKPNMSTTKAEDTVLNARH